MTRILPPCKDKSGAQCRKREVGRQSRCKAYREYREAVDAARKADRTERMLNGYTEAAVKRAKRGGPRLPRTILADAQKREARKIQRAQGAKPLGGGRNGL